MRSRLARGILGLLLLVGLVAQMYTSFPDSGPAATVHAAPGDITVNPNAGQPGTSVSIAVAAGTFTNGSAVTASFMDSNGSVISTLATGTAANDGSFTANNVTLPADATAGAAQIKVAGSGNPGLATGQFTVMPSLNISPTHAPVNTTLNLAISGKGFGPTDTVNFAVAGTQLSATTTTSFGSFSTTISLSTGGNPGTINITATDPKVTQTIQFIVDPTDDSSVTSTPVPPTFTQTPEPSTSTQTPEPSVTQTPAPPTATPTPEVPIVVHGTTVQTIAGAQLADITVGSFTDASSGTQASNYRAVIDWGDGSPPGINTLRSTIHSNHAGGSASTITEIFVITGSHTYTAAGTFPINVTISAVDGRTAYLASLAQVSAPQPDPRSATATPSVAATWTATATRARPTPSPTRVRPKT